MKRLTLLKKWVKFQLPMKEATLHPITADASFRKYYRVFDENGDSLIVMDAPPQTENCDAFIKVANLMRRAGLNVPKILAQNTIDGFLIITDLGKHTYLEHLNEDNANELFLDAIASLIKLQVASKAGEIPVYSSRVLRSELDLFPTWFLGEHLKLSLPENQKHELEKTFSFLIKTANAQQKVFVHRDYMPRNLIVSQPNPGIIDFQDALMGPITYDIVSLLKDAFISWPEEKIDLWIRTYWEQAKQISLPVEDDFKLFRKQVELMGLQRHLKVIGIFARINYRDGKPNYMRDTPRFLKYVLDVSKNHRELFWLHKLVDQVMNKNCKPSTNAKN